MPHLIHRPSGLTLVIWPDGSIDVLETRDAIALVERMALCECCADVRGGA